MTNLEKILDMMEMQKVLDKAIYEAKGVEYDSMKCMRAILDEVGELNHELKPSWCWWKETVGEVDNKKVLGELVDIWHFVMSVWNHYDFESELVEPTTFLISLYECADDIIANKEVNDVSRINGNILNCCNLLISTALDDIVVGLLSLGMFLEFSIDDIYEEYKNKNAENFRRLKSGY